MVILDLLVQLLNSTIQDLSHLLYRKRNPHELVEFSMPTMAVQMLTSPHCLCSLVSCSVSCTASTCSLLQCIFVVAFVFCMNFSGASKSPGMPKMRRWKTNQYSFDFAPICCLLPRSFLFIADAFWRICQESGLPHTNKLQSLTSFIENGLFLTMLFFLILIIVSFRVQIRMCCCTISK